VETIILKSAFYSSSSNKGDEDDSPDSNDEVTNEDLQVEVEHELSQPETDERNRRIRGLRALMYRDNTNRSEINTDMPAPDALGARPRSEMTQDEIHANRNNNNNENNNNNNNNNNGDNNNNVSNIGNDNVVSDNVDSNNNANNNSKSILFELSPLDYVLEKQSLQSIFD